MVYVTNENKCRVELQETEEIQNINQQLESISTVSNNANDAASNANKEITKIKDGTTIVAKSNISSKSTLQTSTTGTEKNNFGFLLDENGKNVKVVFELDGTTLNIYCKN